MKASHAGGLISLGAAAPPCPAQPWHSKQPTVSNSFLPLAVSPFGAPWAKAGAVNASSAPAIVKNLIVFIRNTSFTAPHPLASWQDAHDLPRLGRWDLLLHQRGRDRTSTGNTPS